MPDKIKRLAGGILKNPVEIKIAVSKPAASIKQRVCYCAESQKQAIIKDLFAKNKELSRVIIFSSSKKMVKQLTLELLKQKVNVAEMHSDLDQAQRDDTMMKFRNNHISVLVATDIISRGIDIDDIELVVNYDAPADPEDYVHRIGRTARAGRGGESLTLISSRDRLRFQNIEKLIEKKVETYPLPEGMKVIKEPTENSGQKKKHKNGSKNVRGNNKSNEDRRKSAKNNAPKRNKQGKTNLGKQV